MKDLLQNYDANVLKEMARAHGVDVKGLAKPEVVVRLAARLALRGEIERSLTAAPAVERAILARIHASGGVVWSDALKRVLMNEGVVKATPKNKEYYWQAYEGNPHYAGTPALEDAVAHLTQLGLLLSRGPAIESRAIIVRDMGRELVIPDAVRALLPKPSAAPALQARPPSRVVPGLPRGYLRDLSRYWSFVRRSGSLELTSQGWLYKKTQAELLKALGWAVEKKADEQHTPRLFFLRQQLRALKLLEPPGGRPQVARAGVQEAGVLLPPASRAIYQPGQSSFIAADPQNFWARPAHERIKAAFEAWRDGTLWNELRVPAASYAYDHRREAPAELKGARQLVLAQVRALGAAGWIPLSALLDNMRLTHYEFLFQHHPSNYSYRDYSAYHQAHNPYGISYKGLEQADDGWDKVEGLIIGHVVTDVLHWLGLTDVGFEGESATAYRLTPAGAWLLGLGEPVTFADEGGRVIVQPNFQIVALEPVEDAMLMTLDEFADFEGGDQALTYRLSRESVYRGQRARWDAPRITQYLEQAVGAALPQNVKRTLEEWDSLSRRITIHRGIALLQADEPETLNALLSEPTLAAALGRRAAPVVTLPPGHARAARDALQDAGWLPSLLPSGSGPQARSAGGHGAANPMPASRRPQATGIAGQTAGVLSGARNASSLAQRDVESLDRSTGARNASSLAQRGVESLELSTGARNASSLAQRGVESLELSTGGAAASLIADEEGRIELAARAPNIYVYGAIAAFVEWQDARHARITPAGVRAAVEAGLSVPEILDRLHSVQRGAVPAGLVRRIKAWGKYYGDARGGTLSLIELRDDAARTELLADPALAPFLTAFDAGERALVSVRAADFDRVRALLAGRGIDIRPFN